MIFYVRYALACRGRGISDIQSLTISDPQPRFVNLFLRLGLSCHRHNAISAFGTTAELYQQGTKIIKTKNRQVNKIGRLLLRDPGIEEFLSADAHVVQGHDLVPGIQSLIVGW